MQSYFIRNMKQSKLHRKFIFIKVLENFEKMGEFFFFVHSKLMKFKIFD